MLGLVAVLLLAGVVAIQSPRVQTWLGQRAIEKLRGNADAEISFSHITVRPFDALVLHDFAILDPAPVIAGMDTLIFAQHLSVKFSLKGLLHGDMAYLSRLRLEGACFNYGVELDPAAPDGSNANLRRIFGLPYSNPEDDSPMHWGKIVKADDVEIHNFTFRYASQPSQQRMAKEGSSYDPGTVDWSDFTVDVSSLKAMNVRVADDYVSGDVKTLQFTERRSGLVARDVKGQGVRVGKGKVYIGGLQLLFPESSLDLSDFTLSGPLDDYGDFVEKIGLDAEILPDSYLYLPDVGAFAGSLQDIPFRAALQGHVSGTVSALKLNNIGIRDLDNQVTLSTSGTITGLPETDQTVLDFQVKDLSFKLNRLDEFVSVWSPGTELDLDAYAPGEDFSFEGGVKGLLDKLLVSGDIHSGIGDVLLDIHILNALDSLKPIILGGKLETRDLNVGTILDTEALGPVSLRAGLEADFADSGTRVRIDSLHIDRLHALDYDYSHISAVGNYTGDAFDGRIVSSDPNLNFIFQGLFNLSRKTKNAAYQFYASLGYADLHALHLDSREQAKISLQASSNFLRTEQRDLLGDVTISGITLQSAGGTEELGDLTVKAHANDDVHRIRVQSDYLDASFVGSRSIGNFLSDVKSLVLDRDLSALSEQRSQAWDGGTYEARFKVGAAQGLLTFLVPGLWVENKTQGRLSINADGLVSASVTSGRLALYDKYIKDFQLSFNNGDDVLQATVTGSTLALAGAQLRDNRLTLFADDNHIGMGYTFDNEDNDETKAEVYLSGDLSRDAGGLGILARALPSNIYYKGNGWGLSSGDILYKGGDLKVDRLQARHEDELLLIDGGYSPTKADTLHVRMEKFDIGLVNTFTGGSPRIEGIATGRARVVSPSSPTPGLLAGIICDSTRISGHPMGRLALRSNWDDENKRFNIDVRNQRGGQSNLNVAAHLTPATGLLHAEASLDKLNLGYAEDLLSDLFSRFEGGLSGKLRVDGKLDKLKISSEDLRIEDGVMELDYLRVPYKMEGPLELTEEGLFLRNVRLSDGLKGRGSLTGGIRFTNFSNFVMDVHANLNRMYIMNLQPGMNSTLSGNVYGTARIDVTGPMSKMLLDVDASVTDESVVHIYTGSGGSDSSRELLTFTESAEQAQQDAYEQMLAAAQENRVQRNNINVLLKISTTPLLTVYLDLDEASLSANGNGAISLATNIQDGGFSLNGDYNLTGGNVHVSVMNLVTRDFSIQDGSSIRFNGEVMNTTLDVTALYYTKASLSTLLSDESTSSRRTVNCGINLTGKLRNPEVDFSIEIPDLNPSTQSAVESVLNTSDKVQKQFVYLLIAGNFLPGEDSGISANGSDMLFSNVSSIMSGQLNKVFQKLNIPLDLGLNYQATQTGDNLFDVALSTQLFHNRVLVNGTVGNKQIIGGSSTNEIAGDIDIEIKLNASGSLRLTVFTHSADQFTYFLDNSQRHGAGIAYQREFNSFAQFFRELFGPRRKQEEEERAPQERKLVLDIDEDGLATEYYE